MEEVKNNTGQNLGIAALITAIVTFVLAVIPCLGVVAVIPGIIAIVLASVGLSQSAGKNSPKGVLVAGLIIGIIAFLMSVSQIFVAGRFAKNAGRWPNEFHNVVRDVQKNVMKDLEDANISIKVESNGEKVEINASTKSADRKQKLEELEGVNTRENDTVQKEK